MSFSRAENDMLAALGFAEAEAAATEAESKFPLDTDVPTIGAAPTVLSFDKDTWMILCEFPAAHGLNANNLEITIESASPVFSRVFAIGRATWFLYPKTAFAVDISYRWRNSYSDGGSDGWSDPSAATTVDGTEGSFADLSDFDNDPADALRP